MRSLKCHKAHSQRQDSSCEVSRLCGGCVHRHLKPTERREQLIAQCRALLTEFGHQNVDIEWFGGAHSDGYRTRTVIRPQKRLSGGWRFVFGHNEHFDGVEIAQCRNHHPSLGRLAQVVCDALDENVIPYDEDARKYSLRYVILEVDVQNQGGDGRVTLCFHGAVPEFSEDICRRILNHSSCIDLIIDALPLRNAGLSRKPIATEGRELASLSAGDHRFVVKPPSWFTQSPSSVPALVRAVQRYAQFSGEERVIEFGCGVGVLAKHLAQMVDSWMGVDHERHAVESAVANCHEDGQHIRFRVGDFEQTLRKMVGRVCFDIVLIHAMRKPFGTKTMQILHLLDARMIIYIAPNSVSLLKDVDALSHYRLTQLGMVDNAPHTGHWLTVSCLEKGVAPTSA